MRKYIFISGGVISGLGKGITAASIGLLLKSSGYKVLPIKCENYLNIDAGTINPIEHGDVFLCEDGTEADMDIGTYEKFLNEDMGKDNFMTIGQIYKHVIDKERRFEYNGEDVEAIPYVTDEILSRFNKALERQNADIAIIELGGTVGEYQNALYYEAARILSFRKPGDVIHIHVSYVPKPQHLGEPKTKPAQLSVRMLNSMGIIADILIARSNEKLDKRRTERLSLFCNLDPRDVLTSYDVESVYTIPLILEDQNITKRITEKLHIPYRKPSITYWEKFNEKIHAKNKKPLTIAIIGKYFSTGEYELKDSYAALFDALDHASWNLSVKPEIHWINAEMVEKEGVSCIGRPDGIIVPIGWGERGAEGMIQTASYARQEKIPYLGLCYGMQLAVVAFARDVLGFKDANTEENSSSTKHPVIHFIPSQKKLIERRSYGGTMRLGAWKAHVQRNSFAYDIYKLHKGFIDTQESIISERHRHRYEFNDTYTSDFEKNGMKISARAVDGKLGEIVEIDKKNHPFYIGIQGHPEYKSRPLKPHPLFLEFIKACIKRRQVIK